MHKQFRFNGSHNRSSLLADQIWTAALTEVPPDEHHYEQGIETSKCPSLTSSLVIDVEWSWECLREKGLRSRTGAF